jgi:hypothetical protein
MKEGFPNGSPLFLMTSPRPSPWRGGRTFARIEKWYGYFQGTINKKAYSEMKAITINE